MASELYHFPSNCEKIIQTSNFTLENLLDEDEVVIDVKEGKEVIVNFFLKPENMKVLINYIVQLPKLENEETNEVVQLRYPMVAFEILTADIEDLYESLLENNSFLELLISFFERSHQKTLSQKITLVSRLIIFLFRLDCNKMTKIVTRRENLIVNLIENINIAGIVTFITSMIVEEEYIVSWLLSAKFLNRLVENFSPAHPNRHSFTSTAILEILEVVGANSRFVAELNSKDLINQLASFMFDPNNRSALLRGLHISQKLLQMKASERQVYGVKKEPSPLCLALLEKLPYLHQILSESEQKNERGDEPIGALRLTIIRVIKFLIDVNFPGVQEKILKSGIFQHVFKSFANFPKSNILHSTASHFICISLQQRNAHEIISFLAQTKMIDHFIASESDSTSSLYRMWYRLITRIVIDRAKRYMEVQEFLEKIVGWLDYSSMVITEKIRDDMFDKEKLKAEGGGERENSLAYKDDDIGVFLDTTRLMTDDVDIDSRTDAEEVELNDAEMSVSKFEIENFGSLCGDA